mgnify:FL=1
MESRDFIFVEDVARAFQAAAELSATAPQIINVGTGQAISVQYMVDILAQKMGASDCSFVSGDFRPGDIRHNFADINLMRDILGVIPQVSLADGLSQTVDWALTQPVEVDKSTKATAELKSLLRR